MVEAPFIYSAGYTEKSEKEVRILITPYILLSNEMHSDLRRVIKDIREKNPRVPIIGISYSLGSNVLAKYMGEEGETCPLTAAVCCATPVDLLLSSRALLDSTTGKLMDPVLVYFVQNVRKEIESLLENNSKFNLDNIKGAKTMFDFDHHAIAPMFDFTCASDYYRAAWSGQHLHRIRRPTLILHALNDPIGNKAAYFNMCN